MSILNGDSEHHSQRALAKGKGRAADQSPDGLPAAKKAKPNQASLFARLPKWPAALVSLVSTVLEDGEFEETYMMLLSGIGESWEMDVDHVLQLLAIVIEPDACFPVASSSASASSSPRRFSSLALQILQTSLSTTGPARLLAALPQRTDAAFLPLSVERIPNLFDEADQEEYTAMMRAAARLGGGACEDVWGVAKGESRRDAQELQRKRRARENGARARGEGVERNVPENGWKVLELCATAWETEQEKMAEREPGLPPYSPSFLSQFVHPPTGLPTDAQSFLDIVFEPFTLSTSSSDVEETRHLASQIETASRLLGLLMNVVDAGKIDTNAVFNQLLQGMNELSVGQFKEFSSSILLGKPNLRCGILSRYLERFSAKATSKIHSGNLPFSPPRKTAYLSSQSHSSPARSRTITSGSNGSSSTLSHSAEGSDLLAQDIETFLKSTFSLVPRELATTDSTFSTKRVPGAGAPAGGRSLRSSASEAIQKFSHAKLVLLGIYVAQTRSKDGSERCRKVLQSGEVERCLRKGREEWRESDRNAAIKAMEEGEVMALLIVAME